MNLRLWQQSCLANALSYYQSQRHYLCLATPGAGKTILAAEIANHMVSEGWVDFVLCFAPSVVVAHDFRETLESRLNARFDGQLGSRGWSITYQAMLSISPSLWQLVENNRVLVIFDEIHHCAGSEPDNANAWGAAILNRVKAQASYTLSLTGTPWRSDQLPIVLSTYSTEEQRIRCNYVYGMSSAIRDKVCRTPKIVVIDNDHLQWKPKTGPSTSFQSIANLLTQSDCSYQQVIDHPSVIVHMLRLADRRLKKIRAVDPNAGGLVVASSVSHAHLIKNLIQSELRQPALIVTYQEPDPTSLIAQFKESDIPWVVSVGMISEGTNIPRLQVCCHLTRIKTELHYRQILGRILRRVGENDDEGYLIMLAEPTLMIYAQRVADDLPESAIIHRVETSNDEVILLDEPDQHFGGSSISLGGKGNILALEEIMTDNIQSDSLTTLQTSYHQSLGIFGQFRQEVLGLRQNF